MVTSAAEKHTVSVIGVHVVCDAYEGSRLVRHVGISQTDYTVLLRTYVHTCLLTPWRRVLLEKLTGSRLVKKFYAFHGSRRVITAFTSARQLSLS